ncbi:hypothetical protein BGZ63DRAFT_389675 [Mariannaea sp. PMI_226]|nr:hypothetical protein BGZ63DRAFT_389675 [Mariannaea sp. PMI_226]
MALLKTLILAAAAAVGVAHAGPCKPSTTSTAPPAATTTACVQGLKDPLPADKCALRGEILSDNQYLSASSSTVQTVDECFKGCSEYPGCAVIMFWAPGSTCDYWGPADTLITELVPLFNPWVYDMSCYNFCPESTTYPV